MAVTALRCPLRMRGEWDGGPQRGSVTLEALGVGGRGEGLLLRLDSSEQPRQVACEGNAGPAFILCGGAGGQRQMPSTPFGRKQYGNVRMQRPPLLERSWPFGS